MRRVVGLVLGLGWSSVGAASDSAWTVRPWGGYATVEMKSANDAIDEAVAMFKAVGDTEVSSVPLRNAFAAGVEVGYAVGDGTEVVARGGYLGMSAASVTGRWPAKSVTVEFTYRGSAIPALLGLRRTVHLAEGWDGVLGAFAGMGFGRAAIRQQASGLAPLGGTDYDYEMLAAGTGFASEGLLGIRWTPAVGVSFAVELGLRVLRTPLEFTTDVADQTGDGIPEAVKGQRLRDLNNVWDVECDAGGLQATVALGVAF